MRIKLTCSYPQGGNADVGVSIHKVAEEKLYKQLTGNVLVTLANVL